MIKFYQEFPDFEKVATLSQQLTWSHFVEILPIHDELKRDFYVAMCMQENWSVRTLRERKKSMLYERTAISKKPEETIKNEIAELRDDGKMSLDLFYRDPYMLDFLGLSEIFDKCHSRFKETIATKDRPLFQGMEIYVPLKWIENKAEIFWHSASIEPKVKLDIKPCTNDISSAFCSENCISGTEVITMNDGNVRAKCLYRALRVGWIKEVIELYNENDVRVKYWEKINSKKKKRLYLRYQEEELDYLIVFEKKSEKRVQLITAYPIFFVSAKKDYEKDYQNYIKEIEKEIK